ncbi:hypothetical protein D3C87_154240 [compost metagenome]
MKNIKIIFIFCAVFFASIKVNAQYQGTYLSFYVVGGTSLMVNQNATSTTFNIKIFVSRFYGTGGYQPFYMNFKLGIENGAVFPNVYTITSSDFQTGQGNAEKQFSVTLQNSSLPHGKSLLIHYNNPSNSNLSYTASYNPKISIFNPPAIIPITNNLISLQSNGYNMGKIVGQTPSGGSGSYNYQWQRKISGGTFINHSSYENDLNNYILNDGGVIIRRVISSGSQISYSNEITLVKPSVNNFTVLKTPVYDSNGNLKGNNIKIILQTPDSSIRFKIMGFRTEDDPFFLDLNEDLEFYLNKGYENVLITNVVISCNTGSTAVIYPTWMSPTSDVFNY